MMEAGLNLYSIRNFLGSEEEFLATAQKLREMGYSYLQYSGGEFDPARIKRVSEASGLPVYLTHVPMQRILEDTDALMRDHEVFGCRNIGLGAMPTDLLADGDAVRAAVDKLNAAAVRMKENGFSFFYHHHHFEFIKHNGQTVFDYMIDNAPDINFTVDTYWLQYGGVDILAMLDRLKGRIGCTHLKDYGIKAECKEGKYSYKPDFVPVGCGTLDFKAITAKMKECGAKYFFVEQDNAAKLPDPLGEVAQSISYIKENL